MSHYHSNNLKFSTLWKCCDTCDSKKAKTPGCARVRVRARAEKYRYFHISDITFLLPHFSVDNFHNKWQVESDPSITQKRPVVLKK